MKNVLLILFFVLWFNCCIAAQQTVKNNGSVLSPQVAVMDEQTLHKSQSGCQKNDLPFGKLLSDIKTSVVSFNPSHGDEVAILYRLATDALVEINIYDPDFGLIRTISSNRYLAPGEQMAVWDGKDIDGHVVPDEAYFFTITAKDKHGEQEIYDPAMFSGGEEHDITSVDVNIQSGTVTYNMPEMGRVMIRMGIQGGPLLNTLVDWKPRVKGLITEYWNGRDQDNLIDIYSDQKFKMLVTYFTLPENSVIAFGNKTVSYIDYKKNLAKKRPVKEDRQCGLRELSPHYRISRTLDYSPEIKVTFEHTKGSDKDGIPILSGKTLVKVELADKDKPFFQDQQFEICFFLDNDFYAEDEAGYTPFNWVWDLSNVSEGEHFFTVNLTGFKDQIGVLTRKVRVVK